MSVDFDQSRQRWRVRWREGDRQRTRRFKTRAEALGFERSLVTEAEPLPIARSERAGGHAIYPHSTDYGVRYRAPHVDAPMKKSIADDPANDTPVTFRAVAPAFLTVTSCDALAVPCGWDGNSSASGATTPTGCVTATGSVPAPGPQQATAPSLLTAHVWLKLAVIAVKVPAGGAP